jgi:putative ABC transport system ATP-binding protein
MAPATPVYELQGASRAYGDGGGEVRALDELSLRVDPGEFVAVAGPSGSGKTTLLQLLGALDRPTAGRVVFEGRDLAELSDAELAGLRLEKLGFVFQQFNLIPTLSAHENVEAALAPTGSAAAAKRARADEVLAGVGLEKRAEHLPGQLSGGEQQRVAIARALANEPDVVLADEPTGNLDSGTGEEIVGLLRSLADERGKTVVLVTHDTGVAADAGRVVRLRDGRVDGG